MPDERALGLYYARNMWICAPRPHVPVPPFLKSLNSLAFSGAYWRGRKNEQLGAVLDAAWADKDLEAYIKRIEEAEDDPHRKLGKELDPSHRRYALGWCSQHQRLDGVAGC
jgi:threonyl-tRNA synthetase